MSKDNKKDIRAKALSRRRALTDAERREAGRVIIDRLENLCRRHAWNFISCYLDFDAEVETAAFVRRRLEAGLRTAVPFLDETAKRLYMSELKNMDLELTTNRYGIKEPKREFIRLVPLSAFNAVVVPGAAFSRDGRRLGYGLGFYDRVLADVRGKVALVGIAFEAQLEDSLPAEEHDVAMDMVITERDIYPASTAGSGLAAVFITEAL